MLKNYLTVAIRNLWRNKGYTVINVSGLSIGIACAVLVILYIRDEVSFDRFHHNVDRIYRVDRAIHREAGIVEGGYSGYFQGPHFQAAIPEIAAFVRVQQFQMDILRGTDIQPQAVSLVDPNFLTVFNFPLLSGSVQALQTPGSIVITEDVAKAQFGTADAVGKTIMMRGDSAFEPHVVGAVARNCPQNSSIQFQVLMPLKVAPDVESHNENWFSFFLNTFVVLNPGADVAAVDAKMQRVFEKDGGEAIRAIEEKFGVRNTGISYFLQPLTDIHLSRKAGADEGLDKPGDPVHSYILGGIAVFLLLIACINFINLTLGRSLGRAKEIGIRKVVGGQKGQLVFQFLGESVLLCLLAFVLGLVLARAALPEFNALSDKALSFDYLWNAKLVAAYIGLFLVTAFLAGFYPAIVLSGFRPVETLYGRVLRFGKGLLTKGLVVAQFVLATFFIVGTLTIYFQIRYLSSRPLGYDDSHLVIIPNDGLTRNEAALFKRDLERDPAILGVSAKNAGTPGNTVKVNGGKTKVNAIIETIDESYLPMLHIPMVAGRNFSPLFPSDSTLAVLVNETFVREAGWKEPVGQTIRFYEPDRVVTVVGVARDYHFMPLTEEIKPQLFTMDPKSALGMTYVKVAPGSEARSLGFISRTFKKDFPLKSFSYEFKDQANAAAYAEEEEWKQVVFFSALLTIFISCIGLFGLSVLSAERRTKEVGIRKVLGASVGSIAALLTGDFLKLVGLGFCIAVPLAWYAAARWLDHFPYRISMTWWMYGLAGAVVLLVALVTVSFQAVKAATANPVKGLRTE